MTATVETSIWQALKTRAASLPGSLVISWPMEPFTPPVSGGKPAPYVEVRNIPNANVRPFIGSGDPHDRMGILQLTLCWPVADVGAAAGKTHPDVLIERAGEIAAHFNTDRPLDFEGVRVRVERAADVAQGYRDDAYIRVPVSVRWQTFA